MLCLNNGCKYRGYFVKNQKKKQKKEKKLNVKSKDTACLIQHNVLSLRFQRVVFTKAKCPWAFLFMTDKLILFPLSLILKA